MLGKDVRDTITKTANYYNYDPSDVVTHVCYINLTILKKRKLGRVTGRVKQGMVQMCSLQMIGLREMMNMGKVIGIAQVLKWINIIP